MFQNLTDPFLVEAARVRITELFDSHVEWYCVVKEGTSQALFRNEMDITTAQGRLILSCWTDMGSRSWRILGWNWNGEILSLQISRRLGADRSLIELIPRASASAIAATIRAARQVRCDRLAHMACAMVSGTRIERSALSPGIRKGQPGRFARILLRQKHQRIAVTGSVIASHAGEIDAFLSSALLWFTRTSDRARQPYIQQLWLVVEEHLRRPTLQRLVLFRPSLKETISVFTIDKDWNALTKLGCPERRELLQRRLPRFPPVPEAALSQSAAEIIAQAPDNIDVVHSRHGETLRYFGLPFARVRRVMAVERVWFGVEGPRRRLLEQSTYELWTYLLEQLRTHRSADATNHHHALYRAASEAWLESLLRRNITRLDPGLIIAPLHAQFRTARGGKLGVRPIDLLALRRDGRLVVIELKVFEDREHVLQGVDYWQRVEAHRRRGHITNARLFGNRKIRDAAPLVYLVAPTLRVHPSFQTLARCISSDIEIYKFDINEDWRSGVRVMRRSRVN
jgi:hypothetical protein